MRTQSSVSHLVFPRSFLCLFVLCLLLLRGGPARAQAFDISILFQPDTKTVMQGDTNPINYTALFSNNTMTDLLISNATFNSTDANLFDSYGFFNGNGMGDGSFMLAANQQNLSVTDVASIYLDPAVPVGTYTFNGAFTGYNLDSSGNTVGSEHDLGTGTLHVTVQPAGAGSPTPEFGSVWTLGGLLLAGGIGAWRQHRRRSTISLRGFPCRLNRYLPLKKQRDGRIQRRLPAHERRRVYSSRCCSLSTFPSWRRQPGAGL